MPSSSNHARDPFRRTARIAVPIAWAGLIFAASSRPDLQVSSDELLDLVLRKCAHVFVFGVLAWLVARALRGEGIGVNASIWGAGALAFAYAVSDEWHQTFVEGRVGHASDVAIDMVGVGLSLTILARRWRQERPVVEPEQLP